MDNPVHGTPGLVGLVPGLFNTPCTIYLVDQWVDFICIVYCGGGTAGNLWTLSSSSPKLYAIECMINVWLISIIG